MARPKVVQELSSHLAGLLRAGLRAQTGEGLFPVYWGHPRDFDEHPDLAAVSPLVGLCLLEVLPEPRVRPGQTMVESGTRFSERAALESSLQGVPYWLACHYVLSIRSDEPVEEQELVAASYQLLLDNPLVFRTAFESLKDESWLAGVADSFPLTVRRETGMWRTLGLRRHRLLIAFDVTVPVPSSRAQPVVRVAERRFELELDVEESGGTT